jgi:LysR family transcriptional regulator for metE and metH
MTLTSLGDELAERARRICGEFRSAEEALSDLRKSKRRIVRLATECYTSYHWLPELAREMARSTPAIEVRIVVEATRKTKAALEAGDVDAAVIQSKGQDSDLVYWPLFTDELVLLVSADHPLVLRQRVDAGDLLGQTLILHEMPGRIALIDDFFVPAGAYPARIWQVQLTEAIVEMVRAQMGVSILARWLVEPYLRNGGLKIIRLGPGGIWRDWRLAARAGTPALDEIETVAKSLSSYLRARTPSRPRRSAKSSRQKKL